MQPKIERADSYHVVIHMAGDIVGAKSSCQAFCNRVGLCVTVTPTTYIYTGGREEGFTVRLINYPRFPKADRELWVLARELAQGLRTSLGQESFTLEAPDRMEWYSWRREAAQ